MHRIILCVFVLYILSCIGCKPTWKSEKEESAYWKQTVIDSAHTTLYTLKQKEAALQTFDSLAARTGKTSPYLEAARFILLANYHYFFSGQDQHTAAAVDAALSVFDDQDLANRYPAMYVSNLLFGGQIAYRQHQYTKASDYYFKAKKMADTHLEPCERKSFSYSIAMLLFKQYNFTESAYYFREAFDLQSNCAVQNGPVALQQQEIQSNIGLCLLQLKKWDSAMYHFDRAIEIAEKHRGVLGPQVMDKIYGVLYGNKAKVYLAKNELQAAKDFSLKGIALNARPGYEMMDAQKVQLQLAEIYRRANNMPEMDTVLQTVRSSLDTVPNLEAELEWRRLTTAYYRITKQHIKELTAYQHYDALQDSLEVDQETLMKADITRQLGEKEQALRIGLLTKDNELFHTYLWLALLFSVLMLIIIKLVYQNNRRHRKSLAEAKKLNEEIRFQKNAREQEALAHQRMLTEAVIRTQEGERAQIGLELHDNVNQILTTVKLMNEMVLQGMGDSQILLSRSSQYLQNCISEIRDLSRRLSAPTLGDISLEESVKDLLESVNTTSQIKIIQNLQGLNKDSLEQELHLGVYRIIQEQLNNVIKHAEASEVLVALDQDETELRLLIRDNGKGFNMGQKRKGIGLMNIRTRAETLNGKLALKSEPGKGCRLEVVFPLNEENKISHQES